MSRVSKASGRGYEGESAGETLPSGFGACVLVFFCVLIVLGALYAGFFWWWCVRNRSAERAYRELVLVEGNGSVSSVEREKSYQSFLARYGGTGFSVLAAFRYSRSLAQEGRYREASLLLKEQTAPGKRGFFMRARAWDALHDLALVKGGFFLLQAGVPLQDLAAYLRPLGVQSEARQATVPCSGRPFYSQAVLLCLLSAYDHGQMADARRFLDHLSRWFGECIGHQPEAGDSVRRLVNVLKQVLDA